VTARGSGRERLERNLNLLLPMIFGKKSGRTKGSNWGEGVCRKQGEADERKHSEALRAGRTEGSSTVKRGITKTREKTNASPVGGAYSVGRRNISCRRVCARVVGERVVLRRFMNRGITAMHHFKEAEPFGVLSTDVDTEGQRSAEG